MSTLWGGRFEKETDREVAAFSSSIAVDRRLWRADVRGSIAHARMLGACGVLEKDESAAIVAGLEALRADLESGRADFDSAAEDVHGEIERLLREKIGPVAGKLHTARSRNDQVATAFRLELADETAALIAELGALQTWIVEAAERETDTLMPGLTHFQRGQPVSLAHHLLAYFWMHDRDRERLREARARCLTMPLGSAALAGTSFPLDREMTARELGFVAICENSLDAVSDRDFAIELASALSLAAMHLSRLSEELIIWSAPDHGYVTLDDSVTTGSSIMPQKKNPDVAELIRGRCGRAYGALVSLLTTMKGLPLAYNRDLQEDKQPLFEAFDSVRASARLMKLMLSTATFHRERMAASLLGDFSNATDLADDLAAKGTPFREAHEIVGRVVLHCLKSGRALESLTAEELRAFHPAADADTVAKLGHRAVMEARTSRGGAAPSAVRAQIARAKARLAN